MISAASAQKKLLIRKQTIFINATFTFDCHTASSFSPIALI